MSDQNIIWYPEGNELYINLCDLLSDQRKLVLTSWGHQDGITLSLVTDDGIEKFDDPLTSAPYFPIWEFLDYDSFRDYLDQIPVEIQNALKPYRSDNFGMLMLLSQNKFLTKFCGKYSTLFWLFFRRAKNDHWSKQKFLDTCVEGESAMLLACNLPANAVALEVLTKLTANSFGQYQYNLIFRLFEELDYHHLNSGRKDIPDHLIQFLCIFRPKLNTHSELI